MSKSKLTFLEGLSLMNYKHKEGNNMKSEKIKKEINKLNLTDKLLLVEDIWDSIAHSNLELPLPEWQKLELDKR